VVGAVIIPYHRPPITYDFHPMTVHFRALERMYANGPINRFFRPTLVIEAPGATTIRMAVRPDMFHSAGALHGAAYFKMLDDAAFFAVQSLVQDAFVVTVSFQVYLLTPVTEGELVATGKVVHQTKRLLLAESVLEVDGKTVARGNGSFMRSSMKLEDSLGYLSPRA
jgi:uncharacterized protein (TIGR00369 family)